MYAPYEKDRWKFGINNITGDIFTLTDIDRDEPNREREFYVTVLATDNGKPQLDDVCTFKITIRDINDNAPMFDKVVRSSTKPQLVNTSTNAQKKPSARVLIRGLHYVYVAIARVLDHNRSVPGKGGKR